MAVEGIVYFHTFVCWIKFFRLDHVITYFLVVHVIKIFLCIYFSILLSYLMDRLKRYLVCLQTAKCGLLQLGLSSCLMRPWVAKLGRDFVQHRLTITLHKRTIRRAMVKAQWKQAALGSPSHGQHSLNRWSKWWGVWPRGVPTPCLLALCPGCD